MTQHSRVVQGLTLVELIVVLAVIGLLVGLLIPAVGAARKSAQRVACANHLKQLGLALGQSVATHGTYPSGITRGGYSFQSRLLPFIEQTTPYNSVNFQVSCRKSLMAGGANISMLSVGVSVFMCPSDVGASVPDGHLNYVGNRGEGVQKYGYNGAFPFELDGPTTLATFVDGASNTASISEWVVGPRNYTSIELRRTTFETAQTLAKPDEFEMFVAACQSIDPTQTRSNYQTKGANWLRGDFSYSLYNHTLGVNQPTCTNGTLVQEGAWTAGSFHPGGVNVLFVDGHLQFLTEGVNLAIWRAISSRAGHEVDHQVNE